MVTDACSGWGIPGVDSRMFAVRVSISSEPDSHSSSNTN